MAEVEVDCPYCGERFGTLVDGSGALEGDETQDYFEDCVVCCRPIRFTCTFASDGELQSLDIRTDDE
ncbi:MAG TPA: CPXCG motif-containing cysteine-rich protein [Pseudomonadales bacterium]|nr:CPXCG motif-containing cysteine-rich protein [Pseudomonadales bacterium]